MTDNINVILNIQICFLIRSIMNQFDFIKFQTHSFPLPQTTEDYCDPHGWRTVISANGYFPPSNQCLDTDMIYKIYLLLKFPVPKKCTQVHLLGIGNLRRFSLSYLSFGLLAPNMPNNFQLFDFPIFCRLLENWLNNNHSLQSFDLECTCRTMCTIHFDVNIFM